MRDDHRLIDVLWDLFLSEIASGEPVHFCFSHDLLFEHFAKAGLDGPVLEWICKSARGCFEAGGNKVSLSPGCLRETERGFSNAIVLVCQQVLAVEEMVAEGTQYSENAYFPRLRKLMTSELPLWSANPFVFDEFESIWKTFAREVRKVYGSSDDTITFEFGAYEGTSKARQFPLSQALFSRGDLHSLVSHSRSDRLRSASADDVWTEVRRERYHLTRRAQKLINSGFLRERLIEQTRRFAERLSSHTQHAPPGKNLSAGNLSLFISLDVVDGIREEYFAFLVSDDTGQRVDNAAEIEKRIDSVLGRRGYAYCVLNKLSDGWTYCKGETDVSPGDPIILLAREESIREGKTQLSRLCSSIEWDDARIRSLGADGNIYVAPVVLPSTLGASITLRGGTVIESTVVSGISPTFVWLGGICVDSRSSKYLFPYLPTEIRFGKISFAVRDIQRISGARMDWNVFVNSVARLQSDCSYEIQFPDGFRARLAVAIRRESIPERMGFMFDALGRLSPTLERLGATDAAIVGFGCPQQRIERPADIRAVARLLRDLKLRTGRALSDKELQIARGRVKASATPAPVKRVIDALLARDPLVSDEVLNDLCK